MDPDAALATAFDPDAASGERYDAAVDLLTWLYSGGFTPSGVSLDLSRSDLIEELKQIRDTNRVTR
jgi:hypothetical protein